MNTVSSAAYFTARYQSVNNRRTQGGGVWIKDLRAWALNAAARKIFAPIYNQFKRSAAYTQRA